MKDKKLRAWVGYDEYKEFKIRKLQKTIVLLIDKIRSLEDYLGIRYKTVDTSLPKHVKVTVPKHK